MKENLGNYLKWGGSGQLTCTHNQYWLIIVAGRTIRIDFLAIYNTILNILSNRQRQTKNWTFVGLKSTHLGNNDCGWLIGQTQQESQEFNF